MAAEALQLSGVTNFGEFRWFNVGYAKLQGEDLNYFGVPGLRIAGGQGIGIIAVCQVLWSHDIWHCCLLLHLACICQAPTCWCT